MRRFFIISILATAVSCSAYEGSEPPHPEEGSIVLSEQISNLRVNGFAQDKYGHIWIATSRGLNKYAVNEYQQYFCTDDTLGLPDNMVNAVHSAHDGTLWVATVNGVARRTEEGRFVRIPIMGKNNNISVIMEGHDGVMLFSDGAILYRYDREEEALRPVIREFNSFGSPSCILGRDGCIWSISGGGFILNCHNISDFSLVRSIPLPHATYHMCEAGHGELWLSGMGQLSILDMRSGQWKELPAVVRADKRLMSGDIDILFSPDDKSMLMNAIGKGFFYYSRSRNEVLFQEDASFPFDIPEAEIRNIFQDSAGNLWFGTTDRGFSVSYCERGLFGSNKYLTNYFADKNVTSLCPDKNNGLWIATLKDGLYRYDLVTREIRPVDTRHLISDSSIGYIRVSSVFCDSAGDLWMVFMDKMRAIRVNWNGRTLTPRKVIYAQNPLTLAEDDRGCIWIGGLGNRVLRYDKAADSVTDVLITDEADWTMVTGMTMSQPGRLVLSAFNKMPIAVNTYTLESSFLPVSEEDYSNCICRSVLIPTCIFKDSAGDIWVGTMANGLIRHSAADGAYYPVKGTPCQDLCAIEEDPQGNIWVSTMNGLARYDRTVGSFVHYFEADGIAGNQFNDRASCLLPDGTLVFGGTHGITWFNPLDTPARRTVPLVFENLTIHNRIVVPSEDGPIDKLLAEKPDVTIRANQNGFDISYAALDYSGYEQIRYAYKLEGFDPDWVKTGTRHDAYFAGIPPGRYRLLVRITNASHSVTETVESLNIRVLPPWYKSWWAILAYIFASAFLVAVGYTFTRHVRKVRKLAARRIREERREREKAEEAEKAEKALNRIQMDYFANVAHEFRTPLTMIAGPARQLSASDGIKGQDRQLVDIIDRNSTWMLSLVNQLLDFNRIGNNKLHIKVAKMDIVQPLSDIAELFSYNARSKGIELGTFGLEDPFTMWVDADKVQKVVMNLLSNALKFTPQGGKVTLGFDVVSRDTAAAQFPLTDADTDGQYACITVSDSGSGIAEEDMDKIFDRFYQSSGGRKLLGSGIGLYYARALCTLHHGYIKARNREEGGAEFSFVLPVSAASYPEYERTEEKPQLQIVTPAAAPETASEDDAHRKHVAVVDDDIDIANYLKILLKPQYKVSLYFDATSALKGMADNAPDLIISDVVMPGMDGYAFCEAVKGDIQTSHIPVILVTAKVAVENQVHGLDKGADAYVTKPFQPAYLLALVKSLLENREKLHRQLGSVTTTEEIAPEALSPRDAAFMKELYALMEKELANTDLDIIRISEMLKISRTKFYYKVKGLTGENPSVFFRRYKLNRAADLLREGKFNMSEIAYMTGFNTLSHFSTSFKKQFGVPPSEFRG